jgi:hypothetical protein
VKLFALLDSDNKVINISQAQDDWSAEGWIEYQETNPAFIGGDLVNGYFYSPQPFASWSRNQGTWVAPIAMPEDGKFYLWNEEIGNWVEAKTI